MTSSPSAAFETAAETVAYGFPELPSPVLFLTPNGGCKIPTILCMDNNTVVSKDDVMYLKNHFSDLKMHQQKNASYSDFYSTALNEVCEFLKEKFI